MTFTVACTAAPTFPEDGIAASHRVPVLSKKSVDDCSRNLAT